MSLEPGEAFRGGWQRLQQLDASVPTRAVGASAAEDDKNEEAAVSYSVGCGGPADGVTCSSGKAAFLTVRGEIEALTDGRPRLALHAVRNTVVPPLLQYACGTFALAHCQCRALQ